MTRASLIDSWFEKLVVPSFTSLGSRWRSGKFDWRALESYDLSGRVVVLTGGTSGIGKTAAEIFAAQGATLEIVGRNPDKTYGLVESLKADSGNDRISACIGDLGSLQDVRNVARTLAGRNDRIDVLAHNAGALFPERRRADGGTDLAIELMVAAPFLLTGLLLPQLQANSGARGPSRVLTMSSGGMYTEPLTVDDLEMSDDTYSGTAQYARAKRAQVTLNETWAERIPASEIVFHALHPGWVDTPGINEALPGFSRLLSPLRLLRSARDGADTMVWLAADDRALQSSGEFWHDRDVRSTHKMAKTREADTPEIRADLWQWCETHTGWRFNAQ